MPEETVTYAVIYHGPTVEDAKPVGYTTTPRLLADLAEGLLDEEPGTAEDPIAGALGQGRRRALELILKRARAATEEEGEGVDRG